MGTCFYHPHRNKSNNNKYWMGHMLGCFLHIHISRQHFLQCQGSFLQFSSFRTQPAGQTPFSLSFQSMLLLSSVNIYTRSHLILSCVHSPGTSFSGSLLAFTSVGGSTYPWQCLHFSNSCFTYTDIIVICFA